jgi:3-phenylpropionate/trans-cinnamate dioxygenase ferredoxin subunit
VRTGRSWFDPQRTRVRSYRAGVRSGAELEPEPEPARDVAPERELQAETYPVRRDGAYVVVELDR